MKKTRIMILAAVAMLMAACSSDDESQKQSSQPESGWSELVTLTAGTPGNNGGGSGSNGPLRVKVDTSNPQKSQWETGDQLTVWTGDACSTANMSENGFSLISGADTYTGKFNGRLKSTTAPTSTTPLIAIIDNATDKVNASAGNSVSVDLSEQVGATAESALDYELFYGTSTNATRNFNFTHKMALIGWTIKVNGASDGEKCDIVLSGTGLKNSATLDPATGTLTPGPDDGTITLKDVTLTSAASTTLYVVLPPCQVSSGITATLTMTSGSKQGQSATGSLGDGNSITVAANNYYIAGVNEFTFVVNDFSSLVPGDVIYADDGTTPIAITVYQSGGHGYAIALTDCTPSNTSPSLAATSGTKQYSWYTENSGSCTRDNSSSLTFAEAFASTADNAKTWTNTLAGATCVSGHAHYAAQAAKNYNVAIPNDAPLGTQWVLPSAGMWIEFFNQSSTGYSIPSTNSFSWQNGSSNSTWYSTINTHWTGKSSSFNMMDDGYVYWSCSEYSSRSAVSVNFYSSNGFYVNGNYKYNSNRVRAFLAF